MALTRQEWQSLMGIAPEPQTGGINREEWLQLMGQEAQPARQPRGAGRSFTETEQPPSWFNQPQLLPAERVKTRPPTIAEQQELARQTAESEKQFGPRPGRLGSEQDLMKMVAYTTAFQGLAPLAGATVSAVPGKVLPHIVRPIISGAIGAGTEAVLPGEDRAKRALQTGATFALFSAALQGLGYAIPKAYHAIAFKKITQEIPADELARWRQVFNKTGEVPQDALNEIKRITGGKAFQKGKLGDIFRTGKLTTTVKRWGAKPEPIKRGLAGILPEKTGIAQPQRTPEIKPALEVKPPVQPAAPAVKPEVPVTKSTAISTEGAKTLSPAEYNSILKETNVSNWGQGDAYITDKTDMNLLMARLPDASVRIKDVNGQRARLPIVEYDRAMKQKGFSDRVKEVLLVPLGEPSRIPEDFMEGILSKKTLPFSTGEATTPQTVEEIEGIELINNSTVRKDRIPLFQNALNNPVIRNNLQSLGIKTLSIEPPYKFSLSEEANISTENSELRVNADATDPTNSILHELGHALYESLPEGQKTALIERAKTYKSPELAGYQKSKMWTEVIAEALLTQKEFAPQVYKIATKEAKTLSPLKMWLDTAKESPDLRTFTQTMREQLGTQALAKTPEWKAVVERTKVGTIRQFFQDYSGKGTEKVKVERTAPEPILKPTEVVAPEFGRPGEKPTIENYLKETVGLTPSELKKLNLRSYDKSRIIEKPNEVTPDTERMIWENRDKLIKSGLAEKPTDPKYGELIALDIEKLNSTFEKPIPISQIDWVKSLAPTKAQMKRQIIKDSEFYAISKDIKGWSDSRIFEKTTDTNPFGITETTELKINKNLEVTNLWKKEQASNTQEMTPVAIIHDRDLGSMLLLKTDKGLGKMVKGIYAGYFANKYPNARYFTSDSPEGTILVKQKGEAIGLVMPYKMEGYLDKRYPHSEEIKKLIAVPTKPVPQEPVPELTVEKKATEKGAELPLAAKPPTSIGAYRMLSGKLAQVDWKYKGTTPDGDYRFVPTTPVKGVTEKMVSPVAFESNWFKPGVSVESGPAYKGGMPIEAEPAETERGMHIEGTEQAVKGIERQQAPEKLWEMPTKQGTEMEGANTFLYAGIPVGNSLKKIGDAIAKTFDIEHSYKKVGAPQTGYAVKNYFSLRGAMRERGLNEVKKLTKLNLTDKEYQDATFVASQPTLFKPMSPEQRKRLSPAYQLWKNIRKQEATRLKGYGVIAEEWPKSLISRLQNENTHIKEALEKPGAKGERQVALKEQLQANEATVAFLKRSKIEYVHIPLRVWMEDLLNKYPEKAPRIVNRFFKKREVVDLRGFANALIEDGVIKPQDVDIRNIVAAYYDKLGRVYAMSEIFTNAQKEGLVKSLEDAPADWVSPPARLVPELRGKKVNPVFMERLETFMQKVGPSQKLGRLMSYAKIMQFDNPLFLGVYDTKQGFWLGTFRTPKMPKHFYQAARSLYRKDADYFDASERGAFSKPYTPPFEDFQKQVDLAKQHSFTKRALTYIKQNAKVPFDMIYRPLWETAWAGDKFIRMMGYHYLKDKAYSPTEAAQLTALFHSDYASLPPKTRQIANKIFFTPTFKVTMTKLQLSMLNSTAKTIRDVAKLKKPEKRDRLLATGLVALVGGILGVKYALEGLGFHEKDLGVRYVKDIEDEKGKKRELVIYTASPENFWLREYHRWKHFPTDPDKIEGFANRIKWDLHPVWRVGIELLQNRKPNGEAIYNPFDEEKYIAGAILKHGFTEIVRVSKRFEAVQDEEKKLEAFRALQKDTGKLWTSLLAPTSLIYLRSPEETRVAYQLSQLQREFGLYLRKDTAEDDKTLVRRTQKLIGQAGNLLSEMTTKPTVELNQQKTKLILNRVIDLEARGKKTEASELAGQHGGKLKLWTDAGYNRYKFRTQYYGKIRQKKESLNP